MKISPRELREAQIPSKAFGFNQEIVDGLLERAADTIEGLIEENRQLFEALERMRNEGSDQASVDPFAEVQPVAPPEPEQVIEPATVAPAAAVDENLAMAQINEKEELINKTLLLAQKTADETLKTANEQAKQLIADAEKQAEKLVSSAKENAENLTGEAKAKAEEQVTQAEIKAKELVEKAQAQASEVVEKAQAQADSIHAEEREKFVALVTQLKNERAQLLSDIEILQTFDEEHRTKLREVVEDDLQRLVTRDRIDVGDIPELPIVEISEESRVDTPTAIAESREPEAVEESIPVETFDEILENVDDIVAPAGEEFEVEIEDDEVIVGEIEADIIEEPAEESDSSYSVGDPFAAFVDSPDVVAPAGEESPDGSTGVVGADLGNVESSGSKSGFDPGASKKAQSPSEMDDDDFFASLREAVADDAPLGPSDDDDKDGGKFKGIFKK